MERSRQLAKRNEKSTAVDYDTDNRRRQETEYSNKVRAGKRRTYFFDVRRTKGDDFYLTLTESTRKSHGDGYERHKLFLYKEDFNRFLQGLEDAINYVKQDLMPEYDYDEFTRRHEEFEERRANGTLPEDDEFSSRFSISPRTKPEAPEEVQEDDMSW